MGTSRVDRFDEEKTRKRSSLTTESTSFLRGYRVMKQACVRVDTYFFFFFTGLNVTILRVRSSFNKSDLTIHDTVFLKIFSRLLSLCNMQNTVQRRKTSPTRSL